MVNTFPTNTIANDVSEKPLISCEVSTFTAVADYAGNTINKYAAIKITVTNIKKSLAVNTFSRLFNYVISLATTDINPLANVNQMPNALLGTGTTPSGICEVAVDKTGLVDVVTLTLTAAQIRTDYLDEYFSRTLIYLTATLATDLNPDG